MFVGLKSLRTVFVIRKLSEPPQARAQCESRRQHADTQEDDWHRERDREARTGRHPDERDRVRI